MKVKSKGRKAPYTEIGIRRMRCSRTGCKNTAKYQWKICADKNLWRPICEACDILLNETVLKFIGDPRIKQKIKKYRRRMEE